MGQSEDVEEADTEGRSKKRVILYIVLAIIIVLVIIAIIVGVLFATVFKSKDSKANATNGTETPAIRAFGSNKTINEDGNRTRKAGPSKARTWHGLEIMSEQQVPLTESYNYCKSKGMTLLVTKSQTEELDIAEYLRTNHNKYEDCNKYFLGFHSVKDQKFMSTDGNKFYPNLDTSFDALKPDSDRLCAEVSLNSNLAVRELPCSEVESYCFVCEYREDGVKCPQDNYLSTCYQDLILQTPKGAWVGYGFCELLNKPVWGLMPIDNKVPDQRKDYFRHIDNPKCKDLVYGVAVRFTHHYQTLDNKPMKYNSTRLILTEPLYDCLAFDSTREFSIVTESCLAPNCAICAPITSK